MSLTVDNLPASIDQAQEFNLNVNFFCSSCGDSYLRGVFYPSGTSYFGYTQDNNGDWSNAPGSNCISFFKIAQTDLAYGSSWSGEIKFKPDSQSSYYTGPGEYSFKVGRYSSGCSSPLWSTERTVAITGPAPTPVSDSTPSTSLPSHTPTPTPSSTVSPLPTSVSLIASSPTTITLPPINKESVLGQSTKSSVPKQNNAARKDSIKQNNSLFPKIFIAIGITFLLLCVIVVVYPYIDKIWKGRLNV